MSQIVSQEAAQQYASKLTNASGVQQTTYLLGAEGLTFDVTALACDTKGGFVLDFDLIGGTGTNGRYISLRVNGSTSNLNYQSIWTSGTSHGADATNEIGALGAPNDVSHITISCPLPSSAKASRYIHVSSVSLYSAPGATKAAWEGGFIFTGTGEITSIGVSIASGGPALAATSQALLTRTTQLPLAG